MGKVFPSVLRLGLVLSFWFSTGVYAQADAARVPPGKRRVTIATLGHADHGKSTLTAAITGVLSDRGEGRFVSYDKVTDVSEIVVQRIRVAAARVEYETDTIRYDHIDCATNTDITRLLSQGMDRQLPLRKRLAISIRNG